MVRRKNYKAIEKLEDNLSDLVLQRNIKSVKLDDLDKKITELIDKDEPVLPSMESQYNRLERSIKRLDVVISSLEADLVDLKDETILDTDDFVKLIDEITKRQEKRMEKDADEDDGILVYEARLAQQAQHKSSSPQRQNQASAAFISKFTKHGKQSREKRSEPKRKSTDVATQRKRDRESTTE